jgi:hypothetical protein
MKWEGFNLGVSGKLNKVFGKLLGKKGFYYLMMIASLGLVLGASWKWHG